MVRINILRQISARGKVRDVIEFVKDFRENGKKIILFCSLHEVVDQLKEYFPTAVSVTGRDSQDEKQRAVDFRIIPEQILSSVPSRQQVLDLL